MLKKRSYWLLKVTGFFILAVVAMAKNNNCSDSKDPPKLKIIKESDYFLKGESFLLNCTVNHKKEDGLKLEWQAPTSNVIEYSNEELNISNDENIYRILMVKNATKEHEGKYTCITRNVCPNIGEVTGKIFLDEPFLNLTHQNKESSLITTQKEIQIRFEKDAYPPADMYFMRNGENITVDNTKYSYDNVIYKSNETICLPNDFVFKIHNSSLEDTGNYTLVAYNKYLTRNFTIFLGRKDSPKTFFGEDKKGLINTQVSFKCKARGYPLPEITFNISGNYSQKQKSNITQTTSFETSAFEKIATLKMDVQRANVTCSATNNVGTPKNPKYKTAYETRRLFVYEVPNGFGLKEGDKLWFWQNQNIEVKCFASIYDYVNVTWSGKDGEPLNDVELLNYEQLYLKSPYSYIAVLKINNLSHDSHTGEYTCKAVDVKGKEHDKLINITISELLPPTLQIPRLNENNMEIYPDIENIPLNCLAVGVPPPEIRWEKDKIEIVNNSDVRIESNKLNITSVNSTLTIKKMKEETTGNYECVATANRLEKRKSYKLIIKGQHSYTHYLTAILVVIFLLILLVAYLTWKIKKMKRYKRELAAAGLLYFEEGATKSLNPELGIDEQAELLPYDKKFEFPQEKLIFGKQLGAGAFGVVFKAEARGIIRVGETTTVAVKMVKKNAETLFIKALASELKIMVHLGKHVNIVNLLGACTKNIGKRELIVIVEYCKFGNIHNYMQRHRDVFIDQLSENKDKNLGKINRAYSCSSGGSVVSRSDDNGSANIQDTDSAFPNTFNINRSARKVSDGYVQPEWRSNYESDYSYEGRAPRPLTSRDLLAWAFQIARGMEYLASRKILHGDLAARNVLLAENNIVKICDFGLAKSVYKNDEYQKKENSPLPIKWLAIECMTDRIFSTQSDVWSFGIVLWELFSLAKTPYPNVDPTNLVQWLSDGKRLEKPPYANDRLYAVMKRCWNQKPTIRPSFTELQEILGTFLEDSVREHYVDLNTHYMEMNVKAEGQQDYLDMVSAPDYTNQVSPSPQHYVNTGVFFPTTPIRADEEGYLQINSSPQGIVSPRTIGTVFDFEKQKLASRASEANSGSELTPVLALNRLPARSGSESDQEEAKNVSPFENGCPRIDEEADDVFEMRNNEKNVKHSAVTNPTYYTFDELDKMPKEINNYANIPILVPNT